MMDPNTHYDAVIIGSGQAGGPLASSLANSGRRTALIERGREHVGGTCVNEGCTPTKTMIASARVAHLARRAADYGVLTGSIEISMEKILQRKRAIVEAFRGVNDRAIDQAGGLDFVEGAARFVGPKELEVDLKDGGTQRLSADAVFINVGAHPAELSIDGLVGVPYLNSTSILELGEVPEHLLVLGGGYVGLEFSQMFRRFGAAVTIVERGGQLLPREDADVADEVTEILRGEGLDVLLETHALGVESANGDGVRLTVRTPDGERELSGSHLLMAAGRPPATDTLNLPAAGIETDNRGFVRVNERLETNVEGVWALGDVKGGPAFTHISYDDYRIIKTNVLEGGSAATSGRMVPYTVFLDPQLGRVGLSEGEAERQGLDYKVAKIPMTYVARALEMDETRGFMKAVVDAETDQILGATILGIEGGEIMGVLQMAMMGNVPYTTIRDAVFAHPTLTESLNTLFATVE